MRGQRVTVVKIPDELRPSATFSKEGRVMLKKVLGQLRVRLDLAMMTAMMLVPVRL